MATMPVVRKKKSKNKNKDSLPVPIGPILEHGIGTQHIYRGLFKYGFVAVHNLEHAKALWENGYFGNGAKLKFRQNTKEVKKDGFPLEILHMTHEEALFLSYTLGVLILTNEEDNEMTIDDMWSSFYKLRKNFPAMYAVYHHMRCKGWVCYIQKDHHFVTLNLWFASSVCGKIHLKMMPIYRIINGLLLLILHVLKGLSNHVSKGLLLVQVLRPRDLTDEDLASIACLKLLKIHVGLAQHWTPGMELPKFEADLPSK
ncbi:tRNA-splicing endonuclease subunit Sen2 [Armadillidium nasatum]|uniref:tRNA-splicing endonuclease subunit Sen2 n=1 Tax=Armadillidium nasatum TaxID=96803 RepID=A0A5N5TFK3_9CRUS|nr:tRNA-splicing endonuclease subunit Sen2 [Armadillidium nasatum]